MMMMNSLQIDTILRKNFHTKSCYKGTFASNNIKNFLTFPYAIVANTQKNTQPGEHWVAMFIQNSNSIEYFDSFGEGPNKEIKKYIDNFKNVKINTKKIQSDFDTSCGSHAIYFIVQRCRGKTFNSVIKALSNPYSDYLVKMFVINLINRDRVL
jgi:hypothetical protein